MGKVLYGCPLQRIADRPHPMRMFQSTRIVGSRNNWADYTVELARRQQTG